MSIWLYGDLVLDGFILMVGVGLIVVALVYLYGELRAIFTDASSFATDPNEPTELSVFRRLCAWLLVILGLTFGLFAVDTALYPYL